MAISNSYSRDPLDFRRTRAAHRGVNTIQNTTVAQPGNTANEFAITFHTEIVRLTPQFENYRIVMETYKLSTIHRHL